MRTCTVGVVLQPEVLATLMDTTMPIDVVVFVLCVRVCLRAYFYRACAGLDVFAVSSMEDGATRRRNIRRPCTPPPDAERILFFFFFFFVVRASGWRRL